METIEISRREFEQMKMEMETLRNSNVYKRLLEFENNICIGKKYSRKDVGF